MTAVIDSTLENVQYKFATIIGELCGKPSILSQFAVWLDLRLAEYKLKGSISLDCSGVKPDPLWLQGLRDSMITKQIEAYNVVQSSRHSNTNNTRSRTTRVPPKQTSQNLTPDDDRLSPEIVVVKEEPADTDVFPISLHLHDNASPNRTGDNRKRFSTGSDIPFHSFSSPKSRRMSPSASATSSPLVTHDSSSSDQTIIATGYDIHNPSALSLSETVESGLEQIIRDSDDSYTQRGDNSADFQPGNSSIDDSESGMQSFRSGMQSFRSGQPGTSTDTELEKRLEYRNQADPSAVLSHDDIIPSHPSKAGLDQCSKPSSVGGMAMTQYSVFSGMDTPSGAQIYAKSTVRNMNAASTSFGRWFWTVHPGKANCNIMEMAPSELDVYLAEYFQAVKKPSGDDYNPNSFCTLRANLERYLKDRGYPVSIVNSPEFSLSRMAFKKRRQSLSELFSE